MEQELSSHGHLVFRSIDGQKPKLLIGDLKRFTSKAILKAIKENPKESRKEFIQFISSGRRKNY